MTMRDKTKYKNTDMKHMLELANIFKIIINIFNDLNKSWA